MSCTAKVVGMVSINLKLGLVHRVRRDIRAEGQEKGQRVSAEFGSCAPDKPGKPEANLQKAGQTRGGSMDMVLLAGKEQDGGAFPSLRKKGDFQEVESLKCSLILDMMGV